MLVLLLVPHAAEQPIVTNPISTKLNQLTTIFLGCFYKGGMQHIIVEAVTNIVHSNIHSYAASNRYIIQVKVQKNTKQTPKTSCKVLPDLKQIIPINIYYVTYCYLTMLSNLVV